MVKVNILDFQPHNYRLKDRKSQLTYKAYQPPFVLLSALVS
jgi:hypothetical protein